MSEIPLDDDEEKMASGDCDCWLVTLKEQSADRGALFAKFKRELAKEKCQNTVTILGRMGLFIAVRCSKETATLLEHFGTVHSVEEDRAKGYLEVQATKT